MATELIFLSSAESKYSTPNITPDHHHESISPDSINQLIASRLEQRSEMGTETESCQPNTNMSMISDFEEQSNLTPKIGNPEQYISQFPQQRNHPIQNCQHFQPVPDTTESFFPDDQGPRDIFQPYDLYPFDISII